MKLVTEPVTYNEQIISMEWIQKTHKVSLKLFTHNDQFYRFPSGIIEYIQWVYFKGY